MFFNEWSKKYGRISDTARHFGISPAAVQQWAKKGVPKYRMRDVEQLTGGEVTVREMVEFSVQKGLRDL